MTEENRSPESDPSALSTYAAHLSGLTKHVSSAQATVAPLMRVLRAQQSMAGLAKVAMPPDLPIATQILESSHVNPAALATIKSPVFPRAEWAALATRLNQIAEQHRQVNAALRLPAEVFAYNVAHLVGLAEQTALSAKYPGLLARLAAPTSYYAAFASETLTDFLATQEALRARALEGTLLLAQDHVLSLTAAFELGFADLEGEDLALAAPSYNLLERTRAELLGSATLPDAADPVGLYKASPSSDMALLARNIIHAVVECNRKALERGHEKPFNTTTDLLKSAVDLPFLVATNEGELDTVVDGLYEALYESAGAGPKKSPRYMTQGWVSKKECGVVWSIKDLRNHWLGSHDNERGSSSAQRRNAKKRREAQVFFGSPDTPQTQSEFVRFQRRVLEKVYEFLKLVEQRIQ